MFGLLRRWLGRALWQIGDIPVPTTRSGVPVSGDTAMRLAAVWACVRLLADVVSTLPVDLYREGSREPLAKPALLEMPAAYTTFADWVYQVMLSALLRGNAWGLVVARTGAALRPSQIELLDPDWVTAVALPDYRTVEYRLHGQRIDREELWHFRAYPVPGKPLGLSPVAYAAETIGVGLAAQGYGAAFFGDGATPSGLLATDQRLDKIDKEELKNAWMERGQGRRGIAVLGSGLTFQPISIAPEESQFLEAQTFTVRQIARVYGVPPEMIAAESGGSLTYSNVEQRAIDFLRYGVSPWLSKLERALNPLLPRGQYVKFNPNAVLRTDLKSRYESYEIALRAGFLTVDEVRQLEDREPLSSGVLA